MHIFASQQNERAAGGPQGMFNNNSGNVKYNFLKLFQQ